MSPYGPLVDSTRNMNELQKYLPGKRWLARRAEYLTTFMYQLSRNSGSPNLLEPSSPLHICIGIALIF